MTQAGSNADDRREMLSALADGEFDDAATMGELCASWLQDAQARETWHAYHLIGDVLRSADCAGSPSRDRALLERVRKRLSEEPVVLAPVPWFGRIAQRSRAAAAPAAVAAGFAAVAAVAWVVRFGMPDEGGANLATGMAVSATIHTAAARSTASQPLGLAQQTLATQPELMVVNGQLIRDVRLDRYLAAHRQAAPGAAIGVPGAGMRSVQISLPDQK